MLTARPPCNAAYFRSQGVTPSYQTYRDEYVGKITINEYVLLQSVNDQFSKGKSACVR